MRTILFLHDVVQRAGATAKAKRFWGGVTVTAPPTGKRGRKVVRVARTAARKAVSVVRQLARRNGPVWLAVRYEVIGVAAWARRRPRFALIGVGLLLLTGLLSGWPTAAMWALVWWAVTRIPRARAERRYVAFHALATITRTTVELKAKPSADKAPVRPRSRIHVHRWAPVRVRGVPVMLGTVPARGVLTYSPRFADDYPGSQRRVGLEKSLAQRLRGHHDDVEYRFDWQPGLCRVAFRTQPPLPVGNLAYAHQESLPWHRLPVGLTHGGRVVTVDLLRRPHVILSGATGSGKTSVAMVWLAHLLRFAHVEVVLVDPARLDFHWANGYVDRYASTLQTMAAAIAEVQAEAERRMAVYEDVTDWRTRALPPFPGLVLLVEELAVFVRAVERRQGKAAAEQVRGGILELAESGRKTNVHVVLIAQQPNADVFDGTEARDQFEWNVLCGNPSKEHKGMLSAYGLNVPNLNRAGRVAVIEGQTELTPVQAFWLASPTTPGVSAKDRAEALRWLPAEDTNKVTVTDVRRDQPDGHTDGQTAANPAGQAAVNSAGDGQAAIVPLAGRTRRRRPS